MFFLTACGTTRVQTLHHFEQVYIPNDLYKCEQLLKKEIPPGPIKNSDVHTLIEKILSKNVECRANMGAIKKIIQEYNSKVEQLNKQK